MNARCKFQVTNILPAYPSSDPDSAAKRVVLETRYDQSVVEDVAFTKYTPSGRLDVVIDNDAVISKMNVGQFFYVDLVAIDDPDEGGQRK